ncbi:MAG TPA: DUF4349 domain-containing protein [Dehalococcoidia bacterium]|nr:DUF4349 domain-containing protein [Dehalococcoidia bacterium]
MRRLLIVTGLVLTACLTVLVSCSRSATTEEESISDTSYVTGQVTEKEYPAPAPEIDLESTPSALASGDVGQAWATERMIVRTGDVWLVVNDVPVAIDQITGMADGFNGYVVSSRVWKERERLVGSIAIRVPAEHFDDSMRALRGMAVEVTSESTTSKDVTEEYVDLSAELKNLEATEEQYLRLMEKAEEVEDMLAIQRELSRTRGEIEQTKGRMQYLERTSDTSLIEVRLEQSSLDVEFTADKRRGLKEGQSIRFTIGQIAGGFPPYSYEWDFGDGDISTDETPTHAYRVDGSYTVSLTVTDDRGNTATEIRNDYITVIPGWSAGSIAKGAWNGMVTFGHVLANTFIWIGIFSPVWIIIGGIVYWWRRRRRKKRVEKES